MRARYADNPGFTIVELMIATTVFSTILVVTTVAIMSIGRLYSKGVNQAKIQDSVRTVTEDVSRQLQQGKGPIHSPPATAYAPQAICIGETRYSFVEHVQIGSTPPGGGAAYQHVLWRDKIPANSCPGPANLTISTPSAGGTEMAPPQSRVTHFDISPLTSPYNISIGLAYGDNDLFDDPLSNNPVCKGGAGGEFCATASLEATAVKRITN